MTDWLIDWLFAQVDNTETKLDWKLQCAGHQWVKLANSWHRDKYKLKLQIKQNKLKIYKLLNNKEFTKINVTEWRSKAAKRAKINNILIMYSRLSL